MKNKITALLSLLFAFISLSFVSCQDDKSLASEDWNGRWKLSEDVIFPQTKNNENLIKSNTGTIKIDPSDNKQIIISGDLFGLQPSLSIKATVVTTTASFEQQIGRSKMKGTGVLVSEDKINFSFTITTDENYAEAYKRTATRI